MKKELVEKTEQVKKDRLEGRNFLTSLNGKVEELKTLLVDREMEIEILSEGHVAVAVNVLN